MGSNMMVIQAFMRIQTSTMLCDMFLFQSVGSKFKLVSLALWEGRTCLLLARQITLPHAPTSAIFYLGPWTQTLQPNCTNSIGIVWGAILETDMGIPHFRPTGKDFLSHL